MNDPMRQIISRIVLEKIRGILCDRITVINETDKLIDDLNITSHDLRFKFIHDLQEILGVVGSQDDWCKVDTVGDAIELLTRLHNSK